MGHLILDDDMLKLAFDQMSLSNQDEVDVPNSDYVEMDKKWQLLRPLRGGTAAMRDKGETYLPKEPRESNEAYDVRLGRSFLFPAYNDTVRRLAKKPFSKSVQVGGKDETDAEIRDLRPLLQDIDQEESDLNQFAERAFDIGIDRGMCHILVDFPKGRPGETLDDERREGRRPFLCIVRPDNVIGWRHERFRGRWVLTQLRIQEQEWVPAGAYGEELVTRIRVYNRQTRPSVDFEDGFTVFEVFEKGPKDEAYRSIERGSISINEIPLVTFYTQKRGRMLADPPLYDLAEKNLEHWQSSSDQRNVLRFVRTGILFGSGVTADDLGFGKDEDDTDKRAVMEIGANRMLLAQEPQAKLNWVEHTGRGIGAGRQDLKDIEDHMMVLGLRPLIERAAGVAATATEAAIKTAQESTDMKAWSQELARTLGRALQLAIKFKSGKRSEPVPVSVFSDFAIEFSKAQDAQALIAIRAGGDLTREQLLVHLKRVGLLDENLDVEAELRALEREDRERFQDDLTVPDVSEENGPNAVPGPNEHLEGE